MNSSTPSAVNQCLTLLNLEQEIRHSKTETELSFLMVNRSSVVLDSTLVVYWQKSASGNIQIKRLSNVSEVNSHNSPLVQKFSQLVKNILIENDQTVRILSTQQIEILQLNEFFNWTEASILWCPLGFQTKLSHSGLLFIRAKPYSAENLLLAKRLSEMYGFASQSLTSHRSERPAIKLIFSRPLVFFIFVIAAMFIPVTQSVIAPATIIALQPDIVTAPLDGVIDKLWIKPNERVSKDQILLQFEQSSFNNRHEVANKILKIAQAKYLKTQQLSFNNSEMKAQLALLKAQMEQRSAEVDYAKQLLERTVVHATRDGIAIVDDINSLIGKPVQLGEKIMTIANPEQVEIEIELAIEDAIIMEPGRLVELFLNSQPEKALTAQLYYVGYSAQVTNQGILAYRLLARFKSLKKLPRIGLKGSAKLYGSKVSLFYYLFRRPISVLRQTLGL